MGEIKINLYIPIYTQDISKSFHFIWMKRYGEFLSVYKIL